MTDRKGLLLLLSHWDILGKLPPEEFKTVMQAVFASAGANCDMPDEMSLLEQIAYESINKDVQWSFDQYEKTRAKRAEAGRKGGLKKAENAKKQTEMNTNVSDYPSSEYDYCIDNDAKCTDNRLNSSNATFASSKDKQNLANDSKSKQSLANVAKTKNKTKTRTMTKNKNKIHIVQNDEKIIPLSLSSDDKKTFCASNDAPRALSTNNINDHFDELWKLFPQKVGKTAVKEKTRKALLNVPVEEMARAIDRYKQGVEANRANGFAQQWMNGSTWFNGRWQDFSDDNYEPTEPPRAIKQSGRASQTQFRSVEEMKRQEEYLRAVEE